MMSDYSRTVELTSAAYNASGSAQKQFEKTLDSFEAKTNRLANAWDEFTMGIVNNEAIKGGVDLLTGLLNIVNKVSDAMGDGLASSITKVGIGLAALKTGGNVVDRLLENYTQFRTGELKNRDGSTKKISKKRAGSAAIGSVGKTASDIFGDTTQYVKQGLELGEKIGASIREGFQSILKGEFFKADLTPVKIIDKEAKKLFIKDFAKAKAPLIDKQDAEGLKNIREEYANILKSINNADVGQKAVFTDLLSQGTNIETARLALENEITEELAQQLALKELGEKADKDSLNNRAKELLDINKDAKGSVEPSFFGNILDNKGVTKTMSSIGKLGGVLGKATSKIPVLGGLLDKGSAGLASWATKAAQAAGASEAATTAFAGMSGGLLPIIVTIGGVVVAFKALKAAFDWVHDNSYEGKLEKAEAGINEAALGAEAAKKSYDELLSSKSTHDTLSSELENLAMGTGEFNQKLLEANSLVDQLIAKDIGFSYEDVQVDKITGAKSFTQEAWDRVEKKQLENSKNANLGLAIGQAQKTKLELDHSNEQLKYASNKVNEAERYNLSKDQRSERVQNYASVQSKNNEIAAKMNNDAQQIISQLETEAVRASGDIGKGIQQYYGEALAYGDIDKVISEKVSQIKAENTEIETLQEQYADVYSIDVDSIDDSIKESKDKLAEGIARADIASDFRKQVDKSIKEISSSAGKEGRSLAKALATNGKGLDSETLNDINALSGNEQMIEKVAKALSTDGNNVKNLIGTIQNNAKRDQGDILEMLSAGIGKVSESSREELNSYLKDFTDIYNDENASFNEKQINEIANLGKVLGNTKSADGAVLEQVLDTFRNAGENQGEYADFISNINFDSAIEGASQLKEILESGSGAQKEWAQEILTSGDKMFSNASQLREYFNGADYSNDIEAVTEEIGENGEITGQTIRNLANSSDKLGKVLKNTGMSAEALARVFPKFRTGEIQLNKISDAALEAMTSFGSLEDVVSQVHDFIDNFDYGVDTGKPSEFMGGAYEKLSELIGNGEVGNTQIETTLSGIFGADKFEGIKTGEEYLARVNSMMEVLGNNSTNFYDSWSKLAQHKDVFGQPLKDAQLIDDTFSLIVDKGGSIEGTFREGITLEEAKHNIAKATGTTEDYAGMMIEDLQNNSPDLKLEVKKMQATSAVKTLAGGKFEDGEWKGVSEKIITTKESIDALRTSLGLTEEEFKQVSSAAGVTVQTLEGVSFGSGDSPLSVEDLKTNVQEAIKQATGHSIEIPMNPTMNGDDLIKNYNSIIDGLEAKGIQITPEMSEGVFATFKEELKSQIEGDTFELDGVEVPISLLDESNSIDEFLAKFNELKGEKITLSTSIEEGVTNALTKLDDINIKINDVDTAKYDEFAEKVKTPLDAPVRPYMEYTDPAVKTIIDYNKNPQGVAPNTTSAIAQSPTYTSQQQPAQQTTQPPVTQKVILEPNNEKVIAKTQTPLSQKVNLSVGENKVRSATATPVTQKVKLEPTNIGIIQETLDSISSDKTVNLVLGHDGVTTIAAAPVNKTVNLVLGNNTIDIESANKTVNLTVGGDEVTPVATREESKIVNLELGSDAVSSIATRSATKTVNISTVTDSTYRNLSSTITKRVIVKTTEEKAPKGKYAKGIRHSPTSHRALVGEEGPELIQKSDYAYLAGVNGPEITTINKGDTVYTNSETKQILKDEKGTLFPRYFTGYGNNKNNGPVTQSTPSGNNVNSIVNANNATTQAVNEGTEEEKETWENSFDRLYNLLEDIAEEQRKSTRLQNEFEDILSSPNTNVIELNKNLQAQINSLRRQEDLQKQLLIHRRNQINGDMQAYAHLNEYARYNWDDMTIEINWDKIEANKNPDIGAEIEKYISHLEEWQKSMDDANDELRNIKEAIDELKKTGQEEYLELEQNIFDALKEREQKEIDELSSLNDSLNTATEKLLSSLAEAINEQRQARENERTEESIIDKERRLDYLKQDTSGANALEIKKLEEELTKSKEDYTDDLIDQKLNDLQKQNDEAAEQRERQISIAQANLDHMVMFGRLWGTVSGLYEGLVDSSGNINKNSPVYELLKEFVNYEGMSEEQRKKWEEEIQNSAALAHQYESGGKFPEIPNYEPSKPTPPPAPPAPPAPQKPSSPFPNEGRSEGVAAAIWILGGPQSGWGNDPQRSQRIREKGLDPVQVQGIIDNSAAFLVGKYNNQRDLLRREYTYGAFKTGGLADFTGPAWLDGTKSKPELVLNQQDTQNFIQLKNILASAMKNTPSQQDNRGNISFNINVEVGSIANDYDVDDMVDRIKDRLNDDAMYRNINSINLIR